MCASTSRRPRSAGSPTSGDGEIGRVPVEPHCSNGPTIAQSTAYASLNEMLGLLNTQAGDRYLFSGRDTDQPSVATLRSHHGRRRRPRRLQADRVGAQAGRSRHAAACGRLAITAPTPTSVQVAEEAPATVFGFKLSSINSTLSNATVTGPAGAPPAMSVDFTGLPNAGENDPVPLHAARRIERDSSR